MLVHTLPFLLRNQDDLEMADRCLTSLGRSAQNRVVLYNQGYMDNTQLAEYLSKFKIDFRVLGSGKNEGIPAARQNCMEFIWAQIPQCRYISEIHVDMIFPPDWDVPLTGYLDSHDEPIICPGIITRFGEIHPWKKNLKSIDIPGEPEEVINLCQSLTEEKTCEGFVHPVIHKSEALRHVGGYNIRMLQGKQGYEDDSIVLGYRYYMGTRTGWKPKSYLGSYVYHASLAQRTTVGNSSEEFMINLNGLFKQYGAYGFKELADIHGSADFRNLYHSVVNQS